ncbi:MAG: nitrate/nitrite transporter [Nitriliruptorales bacterium]|nr:nitrate/nitrite transporter [Nitriliruptorales bacterium]
MTTEQAPSQPTTSLDEHRSSDEAERGRVRVLTYSTIGFTLFFAVWVMFSIVGLPLRQELGLSDGQFALLAAIPVLTGSVLRVPLGIWADRFGGRTVFTLLLIVTAIPTYLISQATGYTELLIYAFFVGLAGTSFAVGIAWVSAWYPQEKQGFALGMFGAGNVGASITKLAAPALITLVATGGLLGGFVPGGWRFVPFLYSLLLVAMAAAMWFGAPQHDIKPTEGRKLSDILRPMGSLRAWRFGLYYVVVFGAYVALALWLPKYYVDVFDLDVALAGLLTALFIFPASLLRPLGGWISDKVGPRRVMYWVFGVMGLASLILAMPYGHIVLYQPTPDQGSTSVMQFVMTPALFTVLVVAIGVAMGIGKAAVYKYIPEYFPEDVGGVGGLGGFYLPLLFSWTEGLLNMPQATFLVLFVFVAVSFLWLHITVYRMLHEASPDLGDRFEHAPSGTS